MLKDADEVVAARPGRKRDASRDAAILDAALDVLSEAGYEGMTMDMVATRARAGKATIYRRWSSKPELVREAVERLRRTQVDLDALPDTGSLRGDLVALAVQEPDEDARRRLRVTGALVALGAHDVGLDVASGTVAFEPWIAANRLLIARALQRGEFPADADADVDALAHVVPAMGAYRALVERRPVNGDFFVELIDAVLLPALRGGATAPAARARPGPPA